MSPEQLHQEITRLTAENLALQNREAAVVAYVRAKTDQLLGVMGTLPLKPEELDDETLLLIDPIGIVSESFAQVVEHLHETNAALTLARDEIRAIFDSVGTGILVVDKEMRLQAYNQRSRELFFPDLDNVLGRDFYDVVCEPDLPREECILYRVIATGLSQELPDFVARDRHFHVIGTPIRNHAGGIDQVVLVYTDITERKQIERSLREAEGRLQEIIDTVQTGIVLIDAETHRITDANELAAEITGHTKAELIGSHCQQLICPNSGPCPVTDLGRTIDHRECVVLHAAGHTVPILKTVTRVTLNGQPHLLENFIDITRRKETEDALRESEERYHSLYRTMREGVALHEIIRNAAGETVDYRILDVNPSFEAILGLQRERAIGGKASEVYGETPPPGLDIYAQVAESGNPVSFEIVFGPEQRTFSVSAVSPARGKFATIFEDITMRKRAEEEIQQLAFFDVLTQLPNRTLLMDRLGQALAQAARGGQLAAVLFLDVDRFKAINDTLGHTTGDQLLKIVAERLNGCIRKSDTVARVGGDEFVIILNAVNNQQDIIITAEKILTSIASPVELEGHEIFCSASLGIAIYPVDGKDVNALLKNADMAMYRAKDLGRNTFQFYTKEMNIQAMDRLVLSNDLRRARQRGEFHLNYQPQIDIRSGRVMGVEALLRWRHPELGDIPPKKFIPLAEEMGRITEIGNWVLTTACRQARAWHEAGYAWLKMAVNISGQQFKQAGLPAMVEQILADTGLAPGTLELELTESTVMTSAEDNQRTLRLLKDMGIMLAIDDFGTGYSSLSYLKHFPIDRLKIDRSFIHDITDNTDSAAIAEAIITLAHSLKIKVVAEGVENRPQMEFLRERGCDEIQGFYFCRPTSGDDLTALLEREAFFVSLLGDQPAGV